MTTNPTAPQEKPRRAWPVLLLALPAFVAIWSGWVELGRLTGFGPVSPLPGIWDAAQINTAITLPVGVETYAAYAMYVWLGLDVSDRARRFARVSAIGSLALGALGQIAYHLMAAAGIERAPWPITALVSCLPVIVLGMGAALAHLVGEVPATAPAAEEMADAEPVSITVEEGDQLPAWTQNEIEGRAALIGAARAVSQRYPDWSQDEVIAFLIRTSPAIVQSAGANVHGVVEEVWPSGADQGPEPVTAIRPARRGQGKSNADKARALREKHPDWTVARIAERVGVTERTARRYFTTPTETETEADPAERDDLAA